MITLLSKWFIRKDGDDRTAYGTLCGTVGIILNIFLFLIKIAASLITSSISIMADAMNNLSDAGSSVITILGFRLAAKKPDKDHPFGHGRFEYISGFVVSMIICLMGIELGKSSVEKIISGSSQTFSIVSFLILLSAIAVKLYMFYYNRSVGKKISSEALAATASDSISDCAATAVVLICSIISRFTDLSLDGWCGLAVSVFVLYTGIKTAKETIDPLLGIPPEKELVDRIKEIVCSDEMIIGMHDLVVHNYGPGRLMISLHAEVPESGDILEIHDRIDNIEARLGDELNCHAIIHMDPIASDDDEVGKIRFILGDDLKKKISPNVSIHDLRIVKGNTHTNVIFDAVIPYAEKMNDDDASEIIRGAVSELFGDNYKAVVKIDREYI